ncbi:MAG: DNA polymerase III subunit epsilon [Pacificimonas sp.]
MREIIFDTETTGLDPNGGDRVCEIGAVELNGLIPTGRVFHKLINPERPMPAEATRVHGHTDNDLRDQPRFSEIAEEFAVFIGDDTRLIAHNAPFDVGFLDAELVRVGRPKLEPKRIVDTLALARKKFPGAKLNLDALCNRFGIDLSRRVKHGALLDAELLADVYVELSGGRQRGMSLDSDPAPTNVAKPVTGDALPARTWPERHFAVSAEEDARHRAFVAKLANPVWDRYLGSL